MVMSIGWNPFFDNERNTIEPWLLHEFESGAFYTNVFHPSHRPVSTFDRVPFQLCDR